MTNRRRTLLTTLIGVAVLATVAVVALAADTDGQAGRNAPAATTGDRSVGEPIEGEITSALGVFRRGARDALPSIARTEIEGIGPSGTDASLSVKAQARDGFELYLTPAPDGVCLSLVSDAGATVSCSSRRGIENGSGQPSPSYAMTGCSLIDGDPTRPTCTAAVLYGVVPDGVERVVLDGAEGGRYRADVLDNTYLREVPAESADDPLLYR